MALSEEDQRVVFELAFAIEDPCCSGAIELARELLLFARKAVAELLASITTEYLANDEINNVCNETDALSKLQS